MGTNVTVGFCVGVAGVIGHLPSATPDWGLLALGAAASVPGALLGSRLTGRLSEPQLIRAIAVILLVAAASMVAQALTQLSRGRDRLARGRRELSEARRWVWIARGAGHRESSRAPRSPPTPSRCAASGISTRHARTTRARAPDSSGHNLTGTQVHDPVDVSPGRFGNALRFPTEADYVNVGNHAELQPANVTVLAWVRAGSVPSQVKAIVSQGAAGSCAYSSYSLYTGGGLDTSGLRFYVHTGGGVVKVTPPADNGMWNGQWHLVAGTYDGAAVRLYVDGQQVGSGTPATGPIGYGLDVNNDFIIGGALAPACSEDTSFPGDVDEVRVYSRALSGSELQRLAVAPGPDPARPRPR